MAKVKEQGLLPYEGHWSPSSLCFSGLPSTVGLSETLICRSSRRSGSQGKQGSLLKLT